MAARKKSAQINLLPQEQFAASTTGRVLTWALSTFRVIVIITELVVIVAFLSRFFLDAQNADLTEQIEQKTAIIAGSSEFEKAFRLTQKKLQIFSELTASDKQASGVLSKIAISIPPDVFLESINLNDNTLAIVGFSPNERSIQEFVVNLEANLGNGEVSLDRLETSFQDASLMEFSINVVRTSEEGV
jgi:Tfp pilus assembly protein PilN